MIERSWNNYVNSIKRSYNDLPVTIRYTIKVSYYAGFIESLSITKSPNITDALIELSELIDEASHISESLIIEENQNQ